MWWVRVRGAFADGMKGSAPDPGGGVAFNSLYGSRSLALPVSRDFLMLITSSEVIAATVPSKSYAPINASLSRYTIVSIFLVPLDWPGINWWPWMIIKSPGSPSIICSESYSISSIPSLSFDALAARKSCRVGSIWWIEEFFASPPGYYLIPERYPALALFCWSSSLSSAARNGPSGVYYNYFDISFYWTCLVPKIVFVFVIWFEQIRFLRVNNLFFCYFKAWFDENKPFFYDSS